MFMTFKPSGKGRGSSSKTSTGISGDAGYGKGMQQVAASDATHGTSRNRFGASRRPACTRCQVKKLRCTGVGESCDRCRLQDINCVVELTPKQKGRRKAAVASVSSATGTPQVASTPQGNATPNVSDIASSPAGWDPVAQGPTPESSSTETESFRSPSLGLDPSLPYPTYAESLPQLSPPGSSPPSPVSLPRISEILDGHTTPHQRQPSPLQPQLHLTEEPPRKPVNPCTCIADMLDNVQKLDDDYFRLSTLTFDQVLKVGKYLIFHCLKPMDCASCADESAAHTVILIICDRVAQMMACLGARLDRMADLMSVCLGITMERGPHHHTHHQAEQQSQGGVHSAASSHPRIDQYPDLGLSSAQWPPATPSAPPPPSLPACTGQTQNMNTLVSLFDGATGNPGMSSDCNKEMFSPDFSAQYSNEELLHMIRELARLQTKNMDKLLVRVLDMPQAQRSQARIGRIRVLRARIETAAAKMDEGFDTLLRNLDC